MSDDINSPNDDFEDAVEDTLNPDFNVDANLPETAPEEEPKKVITPYPDFSFCDTAQWSPAISLDGEKKPTATGLSVGISNTPNHVRHVMKQIKDSDLSDDTGNAAWAKALEESMPNTSHSDHIEERIRREGSDWQQTLDYAGRDIKPVSPKMANKAGRAQGQAAVLKVNSMLGLGSIIYAPLPHSCMYVAIKVCDLSSLLDLEYQLVSSKISLGRYTLGASFSSDEAARVRLCVRLVLRHAYASSLQTTDVDTLMDAILVTDYPELLNTMARNLFPKGYEFFQPCIQDPTQCNHVAQGTIDLYKTTFYDRARFSDNQLKALSSPRGQLTIDQVRTLQGEFMDSIDNTYVMKSGLKITFKVPTLAQYVESSTSWFESLVSAIDESLELSTSERNTYLSSSSRLQEICKYHHWVDRISWDVEAGELEDTADEGWIDSPDDLFSILAELSSSEEIKEEVLDAIEKFIANATVSVVGIPDFACPNCGESQIDENNMTGIIPINMTNVFTALVTLKLVKSQ